MSGTWRNGPMETSCNSAWTNTKSNSQEGSPPPPPQCYTLGMTALGQLCKHSPGDHGREHPYKSPFNPLSSENQQHPGLQEQKHRYYIQASDHLHLLSTSQTTSQLLRPVWGPSVPDRHWQMLELSWGHRRWLGARELVMWEGAESLSFAWTGERTSSEELDSSYPKPTERLLWRWRKALHSIAQ